MSATAASARGSDRRRGSSGTRCWTIDCTQSSRPGRTTARRARALAPRARRKSPATASGARPPSRTTSARGRTTVREVASSLRAARAREGWPRRRATGLAPALLRTLRAVEAPATKGAARHEGRPSIVRSRSLDHRRSAQAPRTSRTHAHAPALDLEGIVKSSPCPLRVDRAEASCSCISLVALGRRVGRRAAEKFSRRRGGRGRRAQFGGA